MERAIGIASQRGFLVSQQDIDLAKPNCPGKCAIALAIERTYPNATRVRVGLIRDGEIAWTDGDKRYVYRGLPTRAITATYLLDNGKRAELRPFKVELPNGLIYPAGLRRPRYAGGRKRGKRKLQRRDKGQPMCRTLRREKLNAVMAELTK